MTASPIPLSHQSTYHQASRVGIDSHHWNSEREISNGCRGHFGEKGSMDHAPIFATSSREEQAGRLGFTERGSTTAATRVYGTLMMRRGNTIVETFRTGLHGLRRTVNLRSEAYVSIRQMWLQRWLGRINTRALLLHMIGSCRRGRKVR